MVRRASSEPPQPWFPLCLEKGPEEMFQSRKIPTKEILVTWWENIFHFESGWALAHKDFATLIPRDIKTLNMTLSTQTYLWLWRSPLVVLTLQRLTCLSSEHSIASRVNAFFFMTHYFCARLSAEVSFCRTSSIALCSSAHQITETLQDKHCTCLQHLYGHLTSLLKKVKASAIENVRASTTDLIFLSDCVRGTVNMFKTSQIFSSSRKAEAVWSCYKYVFWQQSGFSDISCKSTSASPLGVLLY